MSPLEQRIAAVIDSTANLIAQLRELDELREQVRKALAVSQESATNKEQRQMSDEVSPRSRFLVRKGCKGWMVYDRQRKGPAMVGTGPAVNLTEEQAKQIERTLSSVACA
jgi:DNA/RNA endonuclease G (NUC1)